MPNIVDIKSPFARSLLRHRLEKGGRIVLLLNGFDEMNDQACQEKAIRLMKAIIEKKSTRLYVTTRPDAAANLQLQLGQLAYTLIDFSAEDQVKYLTSFWADKLDAISDRENSRIQDIAGFLVDRVSKDLKDDEKSFVGVPLHCRILAEFFLPQVENEINFTRIGTGNRTRDISYIIGKEKSYLVRFYRKLMDTKRQILTEKFMGQLKHFVNALNILNMERHQTRLAAQTILSDEGEVDVLCPQINQLPEDRKMENDLLDELCVRFGLVHRTDGKLEFLHRTYPEYLMAKFLQLNPSIHLDYQQNRLLIKDSFLHAHEFLVKDEYINGIRVFVDAMMENK